MPRLLRGFPSSWATPAASWVMALTFCVSACCSLASVASVTSLKMRVVRGGRGALEGL